MAFNYYYYLHYYYGSNWMFVFDCSFHHLRLSATGCSVLPVAGLCNCYLSTCTYLYSPGWVLRQQSPVSASVWPYAFICPKSITHVSS